MTSTPPLNNRNHLNHLLPPSAPRFAITFLGMIASFVANCKCASQLKPKRVSSLRPRLWNSPFAVANEKLTISVAIAHLRRELERAKIQTACTTQDARHFTNSSPAPSQSRSLSSSWIQRCCSDAKTFGARFDGRRRRGFAGILEQDWKIRVLQLLFQH